MRENLRNAREALRITQAEIAQKIGIARSTYANIELGIKNPSLNLALKIKEVLGIKDDNIFLNTNVPKRNRTIARAKPHISELKTGTE